MSMTYLEELTIRTYSEIGVFPHVLMRPPVWLKARQTVARLLASDLNPEDSVYDGMPQQEASEIILVCESLVALRKKYGFHG